METSDISGEQISRDDPASLICTFEDGRRRRLRVTREEAADFATKGVDETRLLDRAGTAVKKRMWKVVFWALALLTGSLAIPALTKQWADRQQELTLKSDLITDVSRASAQAFADAKLILQLDSSKTHARRLMARRAWEVAEGDADARYNIYFDNTQAEKEWDAYRDVIYDYISAACCDEHRKVDLRNLRVYLGSPEPWKEFRTDPWEILSCGPGESCRSVSSQFARAYTWLGIAILDLRSRLLDTLRQADATGFSRGTKDFLNDTFTPLDD
jgi:hypothetical protein